MSRGGTFYLQICAVRKLLKVSSNANLIFGRRCGCVRHRLVKFTQAGRCDIRVAGDRVSRVRARLGIYLTDRALWLQETGSLHGTYGAEVSRGSNDIDMAKQNAGEAVTQGTDDVFRCLGVIVNIIFRAWQKHQLECRKRVEYKITKHSFCLSDGNTQNNPILPTGALYRWWINVVVSKPGIDQVHWVGVRSHESIHLFYRQVRTIPDSSHQPRKKERPQIKFTFHG